MKRILMLLFITMTILSTFLVGFAGSTLDDVLEASEIVDTEHVEKEVQTSIYDKNKEFIDGIQEAGNVSADVEGVENITSGIKKIVAFAVQIISYAITVLLALRVVMDLMFIAIPFSRTFIGNGYIGNSQAGAGGMPGSMNQPLMGNLGQYGGMMNRGQRGMMPGAQQGMGMGGGPDQQPAATGRIQWISNAALNAVAGENTVGPDGKAVSPFKLYVKDMTAVLIIVPILITLAVTGALTNLGFIIAQVVVDGIGKIGTMM